MIIYYTILMEKERTMTIVMFKENDWWIAQCIEYDLAAQGRNIDDAQYEFQRMFCGRIMVAQELGIDDPLGDLPRAPKKFQTLLNKASKRIFKKEDELCNGVPQACMLPNEAYIY